jgi:hypothetical protein
MKIMEFIWGRIGFSVFGLSIGLIYATVLSPLLFIFFPALEFVFVIKVFCTIFACLGVIVGKDIVDTAVNAFYFLFGAVLAFFLAELRPTGFSGKLPEFKKQDKKGLMFFIFGFISIIITIALHKA